MSRQSHSAVLSCDRPPSLWRSTSHLQWASGGLAATQHRLPAGPSGDGGFLFHFTRCNTAQKSGRVDWVPRNPRSSSAPLSLIRIEWTKRLPAKLDTAEPRYAIRGAGTSWIMSWTMRCNAVLHPSPDGPQAGCPIYLPSALCKRLSEWPSQHRHHANTQTTGVHLSGAVSSHIAMQMKPLSSSATSACRSLLRRGVGSLGPVILMSEHQLIPYQYASTLSPYNVLEPVKYTTLHDTRVNLATQVRRGSLPIASFCRLNLMWAARLQTAPLFDPGVCTSHFPRAAVVRPRPMQRVGCISPTRGTENLQGARTHMLDRSCADAHQEKRHENHPEG
jgi:hypothetical protein